MMTIDDLIKILQASIAPVIMISGIGLILLTMTNRLGRSIDRIRLLTSELSTATQEKRKQLRPQIDILFRRCRYLQTAIVLATTSIFSVSVIILLLFSIYTFHINLVPMVQVLFVFGLISLIFALVFFLRDIGLALSSVRIEIEIAGQKG